MVAEKNSVWRSAGSAPSSSSISSLKPMSSMRSASSRMAMRMCEGSKVPRRRWSSRRPGCRRPPGAIAQGAELAVHRRAAVDGHGVQAGHFRAEAVDFLADLHGQFAGRAEDQHLGEGGFASSWRQRGQGEGGGLAGSGGREADEVAALERGRDAQRLDRRRSLVAEVVSMAASSGAGRPSSEKGGVSMVPASGCLPAPGD
jgi:hypothetical protein